MGKEALEALIALLDNWAAFFTLLVVVGVGGELAVHVMQSRANKKLIALQHAEATVQEAEIARMKKDSAAFELQIATVKKESAEANKTAESFRLDIAKANESVARAQAQVAGATAEAAKANLELAKLKTPRSLSAEQQERIISKIKPFPGIPFDLLVSADSDSTALMELINAILRSAGWKFMPSEIAGGIVYASKAGVIADSGVSLHIPEEHRTEWGPATMALKDALTAEGIPTAAFADTANAEKDMKRDRIHVHIGSKPLN